MAVMLLKAAPSRLGDERNACCLASSGARLAQVSSCMKTGAMAAKVSVRLLPLAISAARCALALPLATRSPARAHQEAHLGGADNRERTRVDKELEICRRSRAHVCGSLSAVLSSVAFACGLRPPCAAIHPIITRHDSPRT